MVKALFDTNILIGHLRGLPQARDEIRRHEDKAINVIALMVHTMLFVTWDPRDFRTEDPAVRLPDKVCTRSPASSTHQEAGSHRDAIFLDLVAHPFPAWLAGVSAMVRQVCCYLP